nr:hypothetical protein [Burkholderia sp. Ac-20365]
MNQQETARANMPETGKKSVEQHARIFDTYLGQLSLQALNQVHASHLGCWEAQSRYGMSGQLEAQEQAFSTTLDVMGRMHRSALDNIERVVAQVEAAAQNGHPHVVPVAAEQKIAEIAARVLGVNTLETRNSDSLDFHDTAVWAIKEALEAAYLAGVADGENQAGAQSSSEGG